MIAIVDYNAGNLTSVKLALDYLGTRSEITPSPARILAADRVIFPGVGSAGAAMQNIRALGLAEYRPGWHSARICRIIFHRGRVLRLGR